MQRICSSIASAVEWMWYSWNMLYAFIIIANGVRQIHWAQALLLLPRGRKYTLPHFVFATSRQCSAGIWNDSKTSAIFSSLFRCAHRFWTKCTMLSITCEPLRILVARTKSPKNSSTCRPWQWSISMTIWNRICHNSVCSAWARAVVALAPALALSVSDRITMPKDLVPLSLYLIIGFPFAASTVAKNCYLFESTSSTSKTGQSSSMPSPPQSNMVLRKGIRKIKQGMKK